MNEIASKSNILNKVGKNGKIFSVDFIKKDGTPRHLVGRLGVKKHLKGGKNTAAHIKDSQGNQRYQTIYEVSTGCYKNVNLETVSCIKGAGKEYKF